MKYLLVILAVPLILVGYYLAVSHFFTEFDTRGQFGDMFGAANALFSGFAFLGIIYTIMLQHKELGLQRKELELTRKELKRSAEAQEKSEKSLTKQAESLKITAKLNGLSSLLQFEIAKFDKDNTVGDDSDPYAPISQSVFESEEQRRKVRNIVWQIEKIVDSK